MKKVILFPKGTKRWLFLKIVWLFLFHPIIVIRAITAKKTTLFLRLFKSNPELATNKMEMFVLRCGTHLSMKRFLKALVFFKEKEYSNIKMPTNKTSPLVSIIIPVFNQFFYTYNCLLAIKNHVGREIPYEIIIADDCSTDMTKKIKKIVKGIKVIRNKNNLGFLLNVNNAAKIAKGKYLFLLNNDTIPQRCFLSELVDFIEKHKDVGAVGSKLLYKNGLLQEAGGIVWRDASAWNYGNGLSPLLPEFNYVKEADYVSGASMLIRRELWNKIGGFDERFIPAYYEDTDLCFNIRRLGFKVMYIPTSIIIHLEGVSNGKNLNEGIKKYQLINARKFYDKWKSVLKNHSNNGIDVFHSRDRSKKKKTIFVIDQYVPTFDKDAGSRCIFQYLGLFVELGYSVKFLGDNCAKLEPYTSILQKMGIEVFYGDDMFLHWRKYIKDNAENIDFFFLNRPHISIKYIAYIKKVTRSKIIYFGHDLHSLRLKREYQTTSDIYALKESIKYEKLEHDIFRLADVIYYPSNIEVDYVKKMYKKNNVRQLQLNFFKYEPYKVLLSSKNLLFVGGFGHTPNVDGCKWFVSKIFPLIKRAIPNIKLSIVGSNPTKEVLNLASDNIKVYGYVKDDMLKKIYSESAIFVSPLRYGAGVKGKILEAMYYGLPIVTTSYGAEGIVFAKKGMVIADSVSSFAEAVINLYSSTTKRTNLGKSAKNIINRYYTITYAKNIINRDFKM